MTVRSRIPTKLSDVARVAGVGNATVSRVLNGGKNVSLATAERVDAAIRELGYRPNRAARSLKGASSGIIGMIVPSISDMFFSLCAEAVEKVVRERGGMLIVTASHDRSVDVLESFQQLKLHQVDGLILVPSSRQEASLLDELEHTELPIVGIDRPLHSQRFSSVVCENFAGAKAATEHLIQHGYETILNMQVKSALYTIRERRRGYEAAMRAGPGGARTRVIHDVRGACSVLEAELAAAKRPVGVFASNNLTARYILEATTSLGLAIPGDVAVLSFDDFDLADALNPPMSVVQQPVHDLGRRAAGLLFGELERGSAGRPEDGPAVVMLPTQLILRGSCGCSGAAPRSR